MNKSDNNYLSSNYKETKMLVKVTTGSQKRSLIARLFTIGGTSKDHLQIIAGSAGLWWQRFLMMELVSRLPVCCHGFCPVCLWTGKSPFKT